MADVDRWIDIAKECEYLPENDLKVLIIVIDTLICVHFKRLLFFIVYFERVLLQKLCDVVCELLLEESNVQPVSTPVTVCGDIHGQVRTINVS